MQTTTNIVAEKKIDYGNKCLFCAELLIKTESDFHEACNKKFFGQLKTPILSYDLKDLQQLATQIIQSQMAVTGVQAKLSLSLFKREDQSLTKKLTIVGLYGNYILKPPSTFFKELPELENATMQMAAICGISTVPNSLVKLQDGTRCYITKRIDRMRHEKLKMEDLCQISERLTEDKYKGSHEQIAKLILKHSANPLLDVGNFYEQVLFSFFTGNSDMHLKNFSLIEKIGVGMVLSPAYDLVPTALINPEDKEELALTLNGKKRKIGYSDFLETFKNSGLTKTILDNTLELFQYCKPEMEKIIAKSFISEPLQISYNTLLNQRFEQLGLKR